MASINTNPGAFIALQTLNSTNRELSEVQGRINTGLAVATAKDNGAIFAIAQNQRAEVASLNAVGQSIDRAVSAVDVALAAGEAISDLLIELKEKALAASDASLDAASRDALNEDFKALRDQIDQVASSAEFNGLNLLNSTTTGVTAITSADGKSTITVQSQSLSLTGAAITITKGFTISSQAQAVSATARLETSIANVNKALASLGTGAKSLEIQNTFNTQLSDALKVGIGNLVDADLATESARLQALQVQQQLGIQALGIANQAPGAILALFR
ncbi:MAG: flagellin FljL [Parvularculaceae bacterium]